MTYTVPLFPDLSARALHWGAAKATPYGYGPITWRDLWREYCHTLSHHHSTGRLPVLYHLLPLGMRIAIESVLAERRAA